MFPHTPYKTVLLTYTHTYINGLQAIPTLKAHKDTDYTLTIK